MKFEGLKQQSSEEIAKIEKEKDIEDIQTEEKGFFSKIRESARDVFHFRPKESFKKIMRTVALATVLLVPVGERAFAERAESPKEQTVAMAQLDQEVVKEDIEEQESITEQRELIKEKYGAEIIGDNSEYTLEELQDFESALNKVQKFVPEKFKELRIILLRRSNLFIVGMNAYENLCENPEEIKSIKNNIDQIYKKDIEEIKQNTAEKNTEIIEVELGYAQNNRAFNFLEKIYELENKNKMKFGDNYDVILSCSKESASNARDYTKPLNTVSASYRDMYIHEIGGHLITMNNPDSYSDISNKFDEINKKISPESKVIIDIETNIERKEGLVSMYSDWYSPDMPVSFKKNRNAEDIAEVMTYMINGHHYADNDPIVQEKIEVLKNFLNEKLNE